MSSRRILVVRLGAMGDIVHTLPAVGSVKQSFPGSHLAWAIEERWAPLLEGNPFVDELIPVGRRTIANVLALRRRLRAGGFDAAIDFQGLMKSAFTASLARPEQIHGFHRSQVRESIAAVFYSSTVKASAQHVVDRNLELAAGAVTAMTRSFFIPEGRSEGALPAGEFILANPLAGWGSSSGRYILCGAGNTAGCSPRVERSSCHRGPRRPCPRIRYCRTNPCHPRALAVSVSIAAHSTSRRR